MKRSFLVSILGLFATAGLTLAQPPEEAPPPRPEPRIVPAPEPAPMPSPWNAGGNSSCCPTAWTPDCCSGSFMTAQVEYLLWFVQSERLDPTLASIDLVSLRPSLPQLNLRQLDDRPLSGARFTLGYWIRDNDDALLDPSFNPWLYGAEVNGFFLGERSFNALSGALPFLVRPFFNLNDQTVSAAVVAFPGLASGQLFATGQVNLWGMEANVWKNIWKNPPSQVLRVDAMAGFRYLDLDSHLRIGASSFFEANLGGPIEAGDRFDVFDLFRTRNQFYGGQIGLNAKMLAGCFTIGSTLKYALGSSHQAIDIDGGQLLTRGNDRNLFRGGLLALPSNIGHHSRNRFTQMPYVDLNVTTNISERLSFNMGYSFMYWNRVVRASNQIDRVIDISQIPNFPGADTAIPTGLGRPAVLFNERGLLVHGLSLGVKYAW